MVKTPRKPPHLSAYEQYRQRRSMSSKKRRVLGASSSRPATHEMRLGRSVILRGLPRTASRALVLQSMRRFGHVLDVRLYRYERGKKQGLVRSCGTVEFRTFSGATDALGVSSVVVKGQEVQLEEYKRHLQARDPRMSDIYLVKKTGRDKALWDGIIKPYFQRECGPNGKFFKRLTPLPTIGTVSRSTLVTFLPDHAFDANGQPRFFSLALRFSDINPDILNRLLNGWAKLWWTTLRRQWAALVLEREGPEAVRELEEVLNKAGTDLRKIGAVLETSTAALQVLKYAGSEAPNAKTVDSLGSHIDEQKYGEDIAGYTLDGECDLIFEYHDPCTGQMLTKKLEQKPGRTYCFSGGWRHLARHAVRNTDAARGRLVILWRFFVPGRVGLVPMFQGQNKVFRGYRRLSVKMNDHDENRQDFAFHPTLKLGPEAIDYTLVEQAIAAAGQ